MRAKGASRFLFAITLVLGLSSGVQAEPPTPAKACRVEVASRAAGVIEVTAPSQAAHPAPSQVVWQPVASSAGIMLLVFYGEGSLARMDEPNGLLLRFRTPTDRADNLSVQVKDAKGRAWRFDGAAIVAEPGRLAHIAFGLDWPYGRGVLAAIAANQSLAVSVEQDGQVVATGGFGLSNIEARDSLLAEARVKTQGLDVSACGPASPAR
ncbi:MAG TPA: hypothetical protein VG960_09910 [Caulobacteraceae bacterium]|nr:hypothetical protein [Caulobacteraceae bacterium]